MSVSPPPPLPPPIDAATTQRMVRMRQLRVARSKWTAPSFVRIHAFSLAFVLLALVVATAGSAAYVLGRGEAEVQWFADDVLVVFGVILAHFPAALVILLDGHGSPRIVDRVARQFGAKARYDLATRLAWFNRHWLGELVPLDLHRSAQGCSASLVVQGYPVLVLWDPAGILGLRKARIELFVAASIPAVQDPWRSVEVHEIGQWLSCNGFELRWSEAGLRATATARRVQALASFEGRMNALPRWRIEALGPVSEEGDPRYIREAEAEAAQLLAATVHALAALAAWLHAEPVAPIP